MKTLLGRLFIVAMLITSASCRQPDQREYTQVVTPPIADLELIQRGKYIVTIAGCNDCHSPKVITPMGLEPDTTRLLSGHPQQVPLAPIGQGQDWILFTNDLTAAVGPWGVSFSANLTPDDTGIGNWKFDQFKKALREGKYKGLDGARPLLPPMPWQMYRNMTDEDLFAVFAYLKSLPPVNNLVPAPIAPDQLPLTSMITPK